MALKQKQTEEQLCRIQRLLFFCSVSSRVEQSPGCFAEETHGFISANVRFLKRYEIKAVSVLNSRVRDSLEYSTL